MPPSAVAIVPTPIGIAPTMELKLREHGVTNSQYSESHGNRGKFKFLVSQCGGEFGLLSGTPSALWLKLVDDPTIAGFSRNIDRLITNASIENELLSSE